MLAAPYGSASWVHAVLNQVQYILPYQRPNAAVFIGECSGIIKSKCGDRSLSYRPNFLVWCIIQAGEP
jgi:hypothetical protein